MMLGSGIVFALQARSVLQRSGIDTRYCNLIATEALRHRIFRNIAGALLRRTKPKCIVIANANRPFEFGLWSAERLLASKQC